MATAVPPCMDGPVGSVSASSADRSSTLRRFSGRCCCCRAAPGGTQSDGAIPEGAARGMPSPMALPANVCERRSRCSTPTAGLMGGSRCWAGGAGEPPPRGGRVAVAPDARPVAAAPARMLPLGCAYAGAAGILRLSDGDIQSAEEPSSWWMYSLSSSWEEAPGVNWSSMRSLYQLTCGARRRVTSSTSEADARGRSSVCLGGTWHSSTEGGAPRMPSTLPPNTALLPLAQRAHLCVVRAHVRYRITLHGRGRWWGQAGEAADESRRSQQQENPFLRARLALVSPCGAPPAPRSPHALG